MNNKVVLIVDDDEKIVRMLVRRLKKLKLTIYVASDGQEGLGKTLNLQPDMVLMDIRMPVMDGHEMVRKLRELNYNKLVVACTASVRAQDSESTIAAGCDYFIPKPIGKDFEEIILKLLDEHA